MASTQPKTVTTSTATILGMVCIVLAASLVGTAAYSIYSTNQKDSTIAELNDTIDELNSTINLRKYTVWVDNETVSQTAGGYTSWKFPDSVPAAGYLEITTTSTTNNTYVEVILNASVPAGSWYDHSYRYIDSVYHLYHYDNRVDVKSWTTDSLFPMLPWSMQSFGESYVEIRVGNTNAVEDATETVLVTYYY